MSQNAPTEEVRQELNQMDISGNHQEVDVLIAGQGCSGFAAALYCARYQMSCIVAGDDIKFGGETAIGGIIENYPGTPDIDGYDLMLKFKEQIDALNVPIIGENVDSAERIEGGKYPMYRTKIGDKTVMSKAVILAIGRQRRTLGLEKEEEWTGRGVSYCSTCDAPLYKKKVACVVGGGNAAVEGAILIAKYAKHVYLAYRGKKLFRPEPILLKLLEKVENVTVLLETEVTELVGDDALEAVRLSKPYNEKGDTVLPVFGLMIEAGADPRVEIPKSLGVELNEETKEVHVNKRQETNVPGLYASGDLTDGAELKQTITASAQGAIAAQAAYVYVSELSQEE